MRYIARRKCRDCRHARAKQWPPRLLRRAAPNNFDFAMIHIAKPAAFRRASRKYHDVNRLSSEAIISLRQEERNGRVKSRVIATVYFDDKSSPGIAGRQVLLRAEAAPPRRFLNRPPSGGSLSR